jgi:hypothetical protein
MVEDNGSLKSRNCFLETHYVYDDKVPSEHEFALQELLINGMQRSKIASLIFHVSRNSGEGLGYSRFNENNPSQSACLSKTSSDPKVTFVKGRSEDLDISEPDMTSEPQAIESEVLKLSESQTSKPKVRVKPKSKKTRAQALKTSEPMHMQGVNTSKASLVSKTLIYSRAKSKNQPKPKIFSTGFKGSRTSAKPYKQRKPKVMKTNHKGPMKIWVPKSEIVFA